VPWWLLLFLGGDDHDQLASFHLRMLFNGAVFEQVTFDPLQQLHAQLLMRHLTAAESQGYLGPVPITQETYQVAEFYLVIPFFRPWTKLDFFYLNLFRFFFAAATCFFFSKIDLP